MLVLLGLLCLQAASGIEKAEILTGGAFRPGHWAPLEVEVRSSEGMEGELVVRTDFGFSLVQTVRLTVGVNQILVPVIALSLDAPLQIEFRKGGATLFQFERPQLGRGLSQSDRLIRAEGESSDAHTVIFDWIPKQPRLQWYEAVDAVVGSAPVGYEDLGGVIATNLTDALSRLGERGKFRSRWFEPIDPAVYQLVPEDGWVVQQRNFLIWFMVLYLFASILLLGGLFLWRSHWVRYALFLLPGVACLLVWWGFPGGSVMVVRQGCDLGEARADLYYTRGKGEVSFPGLVKPVFDRYQSARNEIFELRMEANVTRVARKGDAWVAFSRIRGEAEKDRWDLTRKANQLHLSGRILDGEAFVDGKTVLIGDRDGLSHILLEGERESHDPVYRYFRRKIIRDGNFVYGRVSRDVKMGGDVQAVDLAEVREAPRVIVQKIGEK